MPEETPEQVVDQFRFIANAIHGLYLDATMAIGNLARDYMAYHKTHLAQLEEAGAAVTPEALNPVLVYTTGSEDDQRAIHQTTIVDLIQRNQLWGRHMQFLARMCVVALYQYWEDEYRPRLASAMNVSKDALKHDTFNELRHLRRSILHRGARALPEAAHAKTLPAFDEGAAILLDNVAMDQIIEAVKVAAYDTWAKSSAA